MRFLTTPTVTFTDAAGKSYSIYDFREIPAYDTASMYNRTIGEDFDEIYTRSTIAGPGLEGQSFRLHEANVVDILDANFDYDKLRAIKIPVASNL